jgi:hypothetical protein
MGSFRNMEHSKVCPAVNYTDFGSSDSTRVLRRVLPAPALSRVFFPTQEELINYFTPSSLPKGCLGGYP